MPLKYRFTEKGTNQDRETEIDFHVLVHSSEGCNGWSRSKELHLGLPPGPQGSRHLGSLLLLSPGKGAGSEMEQLEHKLESK